MSELHEKRRLEEAGSVVPFKRAKNELATIPSSQRSLQIAKGARTSSLEAPIMLLTGHQGEIYTAKFHPDGSFLASSGYDRQIFFWNTFGECENFAVLSGHTGAILDMHFSTDGSMLFTCSTDKTLGIWDAEVGVRIRKLRGHVSYVNACHPSRRGLQMVCSASDDGTVKIWDSRKKSAIGTLQDTYQITAVTFNDTGDQVISGGIDNQIKCWDLRKGAVITRLVGHRDTITGLTLSPDGAFVLSNAMDNMLRVWDIRAYAPGDRCLKFFQGHQHNFEKNLLRCSWSRNGEKVSAGSSDRCVYIWDSNTRRILYKLPGHNGSVNDVQFHPKEPIVMSASSDKQIYLGELED